MRLVLASSSPRRAGLLGQIGLVFAVVPPEVDESRYPGEDPSRYVERIARAKASAVAAAESVVIAADTAVVHEGKVLGKPGHPEEARSMLRRLQGERHEVLTGLAVARSGEGEVDIHSLVADAVVEMMPMTDDEIATYVATGEPLDKAGAYALQGIGGLYVRAVIGHPSTVVGLPLHLISRLLEAVGADLASFMGPDPG